MKTIYKTPEAASFLGLSKWTLIKWRQLNKGPRWVKHGGSIRYKLEDLTAFSNAGLQDVG